jgi:hypothetical protein
MMTPLILVCERAREHIPTDECGTGGEARLTQQGKDYPRGGETDGHVSKAGR